MDMVASACCARSSARISSISSSTWFDARSLRNAEKHQGYKLSLFPHAAREVPMLSIPEGRAQLLYCWLWASWLRGQNFSPSRGIISLLCHSAQSASYPMGKK
jgi:hypothetical protein